MAGHARYTALLDACVLFPVAVRLADERCRHRPVCAQMDTAYEGEWTRSLEQKSGRPPGAYTVRRDAMRDAAPDWEVPEQAWSRIAPCLQLPDPDDVHVLAAAIAGHADCIVMANLKNFPEDALATFGIQVIHPDELLIAQIDLDSVSVLAAFKEQRARLKNPTYTPSASAPCGTVWALLIRARSEKGACRRAHQGLRRRAAARRAGRDLCTCAARQRRPLAAMFEFGIKWPGLTSAQAKRRPRDCDHRRCGLAPCAPSTMLRTSSPSSSSTNGLVIMCMRAPRKPSRVAACSA